MKYLILVSILLLFIAVNANAQQVIAADGGTATVNGYEINWTIGETVTETVTDGTSILTQGFHQSSLTVTAINNTNVKKYDIKVFPNPTQDIITIQFDNTLQKSMYQLFDLSGRLIEQKKIESTGVKINMTELAKGTYFLKLSSEEATLLQTYKIIKQ